MSLFPSAGEEKNFFPRQSQPFHLSVVEEKKKYQCYGYLFNAYIFLLNRTSNGTNVFVNADSSLLFLWASL